MLHSEENFRMSLSVWMVNIMYWVRPTLSWGIIYWYLRKV
jgi:hypothetical protein